MWRCSYTIAHQIKVGGKNAKGTVPYPISRNHNEVNRMQCLLLAARLRILSRATACRRPELHDVLDLRTCRARLARCRRAGGFSAGEQPEGVGARCLPHCHETCEEWIFFLGRHRCKPSKRPRSAPPQTAFDWPSQQESTLPVSTSTPALAGQGD